MSASAGATAVRMTVLTIPNKISRLSACGMAAWRGFAWRELMHVADDGLLAIRCSIAALHRTARLRCAAVVCLFEQASWHDCCRLRPRRWCVYKTRINKSFDHVLQKWESVVCRRSVRLGIACLKPHVTVSVQAAGCCAAGSALLPATLCEAMVTRSKPLYCKVICPRFVLRSSSLRRTAPDLWLRLQFTSSQSALLHPSSFSAVNENLARTCAWTIR